MREGGRLGKAAGGSQVPGQLLLGSQSELSSQREILFSWAALAKSGEHLLEGQCRAHCPHPLRAMAVAVSSGMHRCCKGMQCFGAATGALPGTGRILGAKIDQAGCLLPLWEAPVMAPG